VPPCLAQVERGGDVICFRFRSHKSRPSPSQQKTLGYFINLATSEVSKMNYVYISEETFFLPILLDVLKRSSEETFFIILGHLPR
jgi:hypothetical protein